MTETRGSTWIISTKLQIPSLGTQVVIRPRLLEQLDIGRERGLSLVSARPGSGKTTLVVSWLQQRNVASAWISLDSLDDNVTTFVFYLCHAVNAVRAGTCARTLALAQSAECPPAEALAASLINDLAHLVEPLTLVLDDFHLMTDPGIQHIVNRIVAHRPSPLHLVLICRQDPALPLAQIRSQDVLSEVRSADLAFTHDEAESFLRLASRREFEPGVVSALMERTEGWATGLHLAAASLRGAADPAEFIAGFGGTSRNVADYLTDQVISQQPPKVRRFMLNTSFLDRFCPELCAAALAEDRPPSYYENMITDLLRRNLLVEQMAGGVEWYRYSQLFRDLLRHRLVSFRGADEIRALHCRAGQWFVSQNRLDEALRHTVRGGDVACAIDLVEEHYHSLLNSDDWTQLDRWLQLLPPEALNTRPGLLLARCHVLGLQQRYDTLRTYLDKSEAALRAVASPADRRQAQAQAAEIALWRGVVSEDQNLDVDQLAGALRDLPDDWRGTRARFAALLASALLRVGRSEEAARLLGIQAEDGASPPLKWSQYTPFCTWYLVDLRLDKLRGCALDALELAEREGSGVRMAGALCLLGTERYERNDLEAARQHFTEAVQLAEVTGNNNLWQSVTGLSLTHEALGDPVRADAAAQLLAEYALLPGRSDLADKAESLRARLALARGDLSGAVQAFRGREHEGLPGMMLSGFERPALTQSRVLLAEGSRASLGIVQARLQSLRRSAEKAHDRRMLFWLQLIDALALTVAGHRKEAIDALARGLDMGESARIVRSLVDMGRPLHSLLLELPEDRLQSPYVRTLLDAFARDAAMRAASPSSTVVPAAGETLLEPLTSREIDVVTMMAQHLTNKEIAARLVISPLTVGRHANNVFQKLNVNDRRQAVARARRLGLIL